MSQISTSVLWLIIFIVINVAFEIFSGITETVTLLLSLLQAADKSENTL